MNITWHALRTIPVARVEFAVLYAVTQREVPAMVPFEMESIRKPRSKSWTQRKKPLFPSYVFVGLRDYDEFRHLRGAVNKAAEDTGKNAPILGLVGFGGRPATLSRQDVEFLCSVSVEGPRQVDIYKPISVGESVSFLGTAYDGISGTVSSVTRNKVKVMTRMLGGSVLVEVQRANVVVAA